MSKTPSKPSKTAKPEKPKKAKAPDFGAKAEATAKIEASYRRTHAHKVTETIPEDVTRAKSVALLDIVSPLREWLALKGDVIRHKREILQVQQRRTLLEIETRVCNQIPANTLLPSLPSKFLIPFVEQASLEDSDSPLVELWANLLTSAVANYDGQYLHFSRLIAALSAKQAQLFTDHFMAEDLQKTQVAMDDIQIFFEQSRLKRSLDNQIERLQPVNDDQFDACVCDFFNNSAVDVIHASVETNDKYYDLDPPYRMASDQDEVDYLILISLGSRDKVLRTT